MKTSNHFNKAIFLDRDGTLNEDLHYVYKLESLEIIDWVNEALDVFHSLWYLLIIISNQSGINRWFYTMEDCIAFNKQLESKIWIKFDWIYICPHTPQEKCECRKPNILHILKAKNKYKIDLSKSFFIGDKQSDMLCWKKSWCKTVYVWTDEIGVATDYSFINILDFAKILQWKKYL